METGRDSSTKAPASSRAAVPPWNTLVETDVCVGRRQAPACSLKGSGGHWQYPVVCSSHLSHKAVLLSPSAVHPGEAAEVSWLLSAVESVRRATSVADTAGYEQPGNAWPGAWKVLETPPGMGEPVGVLQSLVTL